MFGMESAVAAAATAKVCHDAEEELISAMTTKQKEAYFALKEEQKEFNLRRREIIAAETRQLSGYGPGALVLAFLFGSSL